MRRLVFNAGMVATADLVGDKLSQDFGDTALELVGFAPGGATLKAVLAKSGESLFAAQRMARLGILAMNNCRPVAFAPDQVPTISGLIGESFKREGKTTSSSS